MNGGEWFFANFFLGVTVLWFYAIWSVWIRVWREHTRGGRHHQRPVNEQWKVAATALVLLNLWVFLGTGSLL